MATIARPALLADRYGTAAYATLNGTLTLPVTMAKVVAPLLSAAVAQVAGYPAVMASVAAACVLGALSLVAYDRYGRAREQGDALPAEPT
ncbi:hypothetical protein ACFFV7_23805 [Nonomuraea spiralis]|uniref:Uncharacterized protein n=1 Tax=Nonomuraea spiralis TaxID=46182 RepID=A0ABV5IKF4_9ACTN|nr:hypothetical protein [Nonomuraea spiralis]